jgi:hypothetical protein
MLVGKALPGLCTKSRQKTTKNIRFYTSPELSQTQKHDTQLRNSNVLQWYGASTKWSTLATMTGQRMPKCTGTFNLK